MNRTRQKLLPKFKQAKQIRRRLNVKLSQIYKPEDKPDNEGLLHYIVKQHLQEQLQKTNTLDVNRHCLVRQSDAESLPPYWNCTNRLHTKKFVSGWDKVEQEFSLSGIGKFDIALINSKENKIAGIVEVLSTSKMSDKKVDRLKSEGIPWVEILANMHLPSSWNYKMPLVPFRISDFQFICESCTNLQSDFELSSFASIVDFYLPPTRNGFNRMMWKLYTIWKNKNDISEQNLHLIDFSHLIIAKRFFHQKPLKLVGKGNIKELQSLHSHVVNSFKLFVGQQHQVLNQTEDLTEDFDLQSAETVNYVTPIFVDRSNLEWPGLCKLDFVNRFLNDEFINPHFLSSPRMIATAIQRFGVHAYSWDRSQHFWKKK